MIVKNNSIVIFIGILCSLSPIFADHHQIEGRSIQSALNTDNEWRPIGPLDPLRNGPTFHYSPPALSRVRYWEEQRDLTSTTTAKPEKNEVLLLGVPSKHSMKMNPNEILEQTPINRRAYVVPQPSRFMSPPPMPGNYINSPFELSYWEQGTKPFGDSFAEESVAQLTILKPKTNPHPYLSTSPSVYRNFTNSIYNFAAKVNSLETPDSKKPWLQDLLHKEIHFQNLFPRPQIETSYSPSVFESHTTINEHGQEIQKTPAQPFITLNTIPSTTTVATTLAQNIILDYKPTVETRGPTYMIIQGHSKVKTYSGGQQSSNITEKHSPRIVPVESMKDPIIKHVVSDDFKTEKMHVFFNTTQKLKTPVKKYSSNSTMDGLLSLLDSSLGFLMNPEKSKAVKQGIKISDKDFDGLKMNLSEKATTEKEK